MARKVRGDVFNSELIAQRLRWTDGEMRTFAWLPHIEVRGLASRQQLRLLFAGRRGLNNELTEILSALYGLLRY
jgi:hypothetical protein